MAGLRSLKTSILLKSREEALEIVMQRRHKRITPTGRVPTKIKKAVEKDKKQKSLISGLNPNQIQQILNAVKPQRKE